MDHPIPNNPYTKAHYNTAQQCLRTLHDVLPLIDASEKCGIPCQDYRAMVENMQASLLALVENFMSPPPMK